MIFLVFFFDVLVLVVLIGERYVFEGDLSEVAVRSDRIFGHLDVARHLHQAVVPLDVDVPIHEATLDPGEILDPPDDHIRPADVGDRVADRYLPVTGHEASHEINSGDCEDGHKPVAVRAPDDGHIRLEDQRVRLRKCFGVVFRGFLLLRVQLDELDVSEDLALDLAGTTVFPTCFLKRTDVFGVGARCSQGEQGTPPKHDQSHRELRTEKHRGCYETAAAQRENVPQRHVRYLLVRAFSALDDLLLYT